MPELRDKTGTSKTDRVAEKKGAPIGVILSVALILAIVGAAAALIVPQMVGGDDDPETRVGGPAAAGPQGLDELFPAPPERDRLDRVMLVAGDDYPFGRTLDQHPASGARDPSAAPGGLALIKYLNSSVWVSTTDGPESIDDRGIAHGFSHTPQGAALAASWLLGYVSNLEVDAAAAEEGVSLTDGEKADPADRAKYKDQAAEMAAPMAMKVDWDPRLTNVAMAFPTTDGKWLVISIDAEWRDGQWATRADSSEQSTLATLPTGFVRWDSAR